MSSHAFYPVVVRRHPVAVRRTRTHVPVFPARRHLPRVIHSRAPRAGSAGRDACRPGYLFPLPEAVSRDGHVPAGLGPGQGHLVMGRRRCQAARLSRGLPRRRHLTRLAMAVLGSGQPARLRANTRKS